ncbi:hypothetical protein D3C81_1414200 [compost metagenome]
MLAEAARHAEPDRAAQPLPQALHRLLRRHHFVANGPGVLIQLPAQLRRLQLPRGATQQFRTNLPLEVVEALADVGAAHAQLRGGTAEIAGLDDVHQQGKPVQVHCQLSIFICVANW